MTVKQQPLNKPRRGLAAPLSREHLDRAGPWLRLSAGLMLIMYTGYTTIRGVGEDFAPLLQGDIYGISMRLIGGLAAAALISLVEWLTSERYPIIYCVALWFDARYTQRQLGPSIDSLAAYHLQGLDAWIPTVVSFAMSWGLSFLAARYGEVLLFGKRRRKETDQE